MCTDADARWLFDALSNSTVKSDVKISRATHLMHLEESRYALYRETQTFLEGETKLMNKSTVVHEAETDSIAGYDYGRPSAARSPVSLEELRQLEATVGWSGEDAELLLAHEGRHRRRKPQRGREAEVFLDASRVREVQVRVAVREPGEHRLAPAVDHVGARRIGHAVGLVDGGDPVVVDDQRRVVMDRPRGVGADDGRVADGRPHRRGV